MNQNLIFAPMGALAFLTFAVLLVIPFRRFRAAIAGAVTADDFKFGESSAVPGSVSIPNRNYMNLLEAPTLFFPACLMFFLTQRVDTAALALAWSYVGLRAVHSAIHLTYNKVFHRLTAFAASNVVLALLWLLFFVRAA
jgi:hypothetical protein